MIAAGSHSEAQGGQSGLQAEVLLHHWRAIVIPKYVKKSPFSQWQCNPGSVVTVGITNLPAPAHTEWFPYCKDWKPLV